MNGWGVPPRFYKPTHLNPTLWLIVSLTYPMSHPPIWEICWKWYPSLENLTAKNPPIWAAHTRTINMLSTPPPGHQNTGSHHLCIHHLYISCYTILILSVLKTLLFSCFRLFAECFDNSTNSQYQRSSKISKTILRKGEAKDAKRWDWGDLQ